MTINISANNLFADMQAMATQARGTTGASADIAELNSGAINPTGKNSSQMDFSGMLEDAINNVNSIGKQAGVLKTAVEMGDRSVSMAEAMIASQKAGIAFEATVQVRNKLLEAYKEIMSMPV